MKELMFFVKINLHVQFDSLNTKCAFLFSYRSYKWFWVPIVAPLIGSVLGAWLYSITIGIHIPSEIDDLEEKVRQLQSDKNIVTNQHTFSEKLNIDTESKLLLSNGSDENEIKALNEHYYNHFAVHNQ